MQNNPEAQSFLTTEFFFYMLPCYCAIGSFIYRYIIIMKQQPKINVPEIPLQFLVSCFEEKFEYDSAVIPPASYTIKLKLSLLNSYTYFVMVLLGVLGDPDLYYSAQHRTYSAIYLFGFIAWSMSALVLRRQFQRNINQSLWTHRFFWMFAGTFSITKMFEDYLLPLNLLINSLFILNNSILIIYALYKPEDKNQAYFHSSDEIPSFAKLFFQKLELNHYVRKIFKIENQQFRINDSQQIQIENTQLARQLEVYYNNMLPTGQAIEEEIKLLNKLPKRNILVSKKPKIKRINDSIKYYFIIITQLNVHRFEAERKYSDFLELQNSLAMHFSESNFPKLKLPRINKSQFNNLAQNENGRRAQILEQWLQALLLDPIFIIQFVLQFLNIDEQYSASFLTYYNVSFKSVCSKNFLLNSFKIQNEGTTNFTANDLVKTKSNQYRNLTKKIKIKLEFEVNFFEQTQQNVLVFEIVCKINKKDTRKWTISKSEDHFAILNTNIEQEIGKPVHFYYKYKSKTESPVKGNRRNNYKRYLQQLLENQEYYTYALFEFIFFDPVKLQLIGDRNSRNSVHLKRISQTHNYSILETAFPQTTNPIEVLAITISELDDGQIEYLFKIKCNGQYYHKKSAELLRLRNNLIKTYKSICVIPEIPDLSRATPDEIHQIKSSMDSFLSKIAGFQQINETPSYVNFYK